jgi:SAM-dependent methyltransferase
MPPSAYVTPDDHQPLTEREGGLSSADGRRFPYVPDVRGNPIPQFVEVPNVHARQALYHDPRAVEMYDNYLNWLFSTFAADEVEIRGRMAAKLRLKPGGRALVTGCGLGNDVPFLSEFVGRAGEVYAQDLSHAMVVAAQKRTLARQLKGPAVNTDRVYYSVSDACVLPFPDGFFNAAFHFGGLNDFPDRRAALAEMARVVRMGGRVVVGDEGVAPWLREIDYGKMTVCNNKLWAMEPPLVLLPTTSTDVNLSWILGNCFYLIDFEVGDRLPFINPDVPHKGRRGGSMRTRYFGQLEGIDPDLKAKSYVAADRSGQSVSAWLESVIRKAV